MNISIEAPVGVLGIGVEGRSTIEYLLKHGFCDITALDRAEISGLPNGVRRVFGPSHDEGLDRFRTIFRSPGIRPDIPALVRARQSGTRVTSAISLFLDRCPAKVIGITGTLGKGTASALTASLLEASGFTVHLGGNIGKSPLDFLDEAAPEHWVVLEISSFQAMDVTASPHIGVVLKTTSEHLDWHLDLAEYYAAKARLFEFQTRGDVLIYNAEIEGSKTVAMKGTAVRVPFSTRRSLDDGIFAAGDRLILRRGNERVELPLRLDRLRLPGTFNIENVAAATAAALAAGASPDAIGRAAESFEGLPHRLQFVAEVQGVRFFNDSYATRPDATLGAVTSLASDPLAVILGGSEKFADFSELVFTLRALPTVRYAALIGRTAPRLAEALAAAGPCPFPVEIHPGLTEATAAAFQAVSPVAGVVLLSPACASFGLFPNYKVRGERFVETVRGLKS